MPSKTYLIWNIYILKDWEEYRYHEHFYKPDHLMLLGFKIDGITPIYKHKLFMASYK